MSKFLKDSSFNIVGQIVVLVFGLAAGILLARVLGPASKGILTGIYLVPDTLNALLASGFGSSVVYFVSSEKWTHSEALSRVLGLTTYLVLLVTLAGLLVVGFGMPWLTPLPQSLLLVGLVIIPLKLLRQSFICLLQGRQRFRAIFFNNVFTAVATLLSIVAAIAVAFEWFPNRLVVAALIGQIVASTLSLAFLLFSIRRVYAGVSWVPELRWRSLQPAFSYGGRAHAANAVGFLNYRADQLIVNGMLGPASLGIYSVAVNLAERLWLVVSNASAVLMPRIAAGKDITHNAEITSQLARVMLALLLLSCAMLAGLSPYLIPLMFGAAYAGAVIPLICLLPGIAAMGYTKVVSNYLAAVGRPEINARNATVGLVVNIVANVLLIPGYGIMGAAIATSISYSIICLLCFASYLKMTGSAWHDAVVLRRQDLVRVVSMFRSLFPAAAA